MRNGRGKPFASAVALIAVALVAAACSSSSSSSSTTSSSGGSPASGTPIKIALITSETGIAASQFQTTRQGFLARIDLQNAQGGVNGHKIVGTVYDDGGSLTSVATVTKLAISNGNVGIVAVSPFFFNAYKYPQQAGIPVTGGSFDGFEWGTKPNTNMFASDGGNTNPDAPYTLAIGQFMKAHGGTVVGSYGYGISPTSTYGANATAKAAKAAGLKVGVLDTSVPFGGVDFTAAALTAKAAGVNALYGAMDNNSNFALLTTLKQSGINPKIVEFPTGYEPDIIGSPAWQVVQGAYFPSAFRPTSIPNAATVTMVGALQQYQNRKPADFPTFNIYESWLGADLMLEGIKLAGANPTSASVITALRGITSYNGSGILSVSLNYKTNFGVGSTVGCAWYMKAEARGFVPDSKTPTCSSFVPGSTSKTPPS